MKIETKQDKEGFYLSLQEIYCGVVLETREGNQISICMRDDTIEFNVIKFDKWYRINMQTGEIESQN